MFFSECFDINLSLIFELNFLYSTRLWTGNGTYSSRCKPKGTLLLDVTLDITSLCLILNKKHGEVHPESHTTEPLYVTGSFKDKRSPDIQISYAGGRQMIPFLISSLIFFIGHDSSLWTGMGLNSPRCKTSFPGHPNFLQFRA